MVCQYLCVIKISLSHGQHGLKNSVRHEASKDSSGSMETLQLNLKIMPTTVTNRLGQKVPIDVSKIRDVVSEAWVLSVLQVLQVILSVMIT